MLGKSRLKPKKIWVDKDSELYNRSIKTYFARQRYRNVFNT